MTHAHREISELLPWYVNGRIGEQERLRLDAHLPECASCREALAHERIVYQSVSAESAVEYMPAASLKRLQARLDGLEAVATAAVVTAPVATAAAARQAPVTEKRRRRSMPWQGLMAASVAVMAAAVSMLAADRWMESRAAASKANYYTVTTATARAPGEVIRAVFSPTITLVELQAILDAAQLRIISGPSEAGVYSLAANSRRPVRSSLTSLRGNANVRFAESTGSDSGTGHSP